MVAGDTLPRPFLELQCNPAVRKQTWRKLSNLTAVPLSGQRMMRVSPEQPMALSQAG